MAYGDTSPLRRVTRRHRVSWRGRRRLKFQRLEELECGHVTVQDDPHDERWGRKPYPERRRCYCCTSGEKLNSASQRSLRRDAGWEENDNG